MVEIPEIPLEKYKVPDSDLKSELGIENTAEGSLDFAVVGSGQCGGRLAKSFYDLGVRKVLALNTALADLNPLELPDNQKLKIGTTQGSGRSMDIGQRATKEAEQIIFDRMKDIFGTVDKIIICVGFGGGTGAGGCNTLINIAQEYLAFIKQTDQITTDVIVIGALPTRGELNSPSIRMNLEQIRKIIKRRIDKKEVGPVFLIDNAKIERMYRGIPTTKQYSVINDTITTLFNIFNTLSKRESKYISFDAKDYETLLDTPGLAVMGATLLEVENLKDTNLSQALQENFRKTLLADDLNYESAKSSGCIIVAGTSVLDSVAMEVFNYGFDSMSNLVGKADIHRGLYDAEGNVVRAYTMICGIDVVA